jgi:uncharacterized protein YndB with AHSA1/START domain
MTRSARTKITGEFGKQELIIIREFDAPQELVFKAFTDPELYIQWLGPRGSNITIEKFNPENGGEWQYIYRNAKGDEYIFYGVYHEVKPPYKIVNTFEFKHPSGFVTLQIATFEALPENKTMFTGKSIFESVEERDGELRVLQGGADYTYDRLAELLNVLK